MPSSSSIFQTQWSIDNTIFKAGDVLIKLIQASGYDEVQPPAVLAFEALGSSMIICTDRINEGMNALDSRGSSERFALFKIAIGLTPGGIGHFIRKEAKRCVPAFLLTASLKIFLTDQEIGNVLFEMLVHQGLAEKPELRCSRQQLSALVSAISGFCDPITPQNTVQTVLSAIQRQIEPRGMAKAYANFGPKSLAELLSRVFGACQDSDINLVTVRGFSGGLLLATTLLWLKEDEVELIVSGEVIQSTPGRKLSVRLDVEEQGNNDWIIQEWRQVESPSTVIVTNPMDMQPLPHTLATKFVPAITAKDTIKAQYTLSSEQVNEVGRLANALILLALEHGRLVFRPSMPGVRPYFVPLRDICQPSYLASVFDSMICYGWHREDTHGADLIASEIQEWMAQLCPGFSEPLSPKDSHPLHDIPIRQVSHILELIDTWRKTRPGAYSQSWSDAISEPAVYLAALSIFSSICSSFPANRTFPVGSYASIADSGLVILDLAFSSLLTRSLPSKWRDSPFLKEIRRHQNAARSFSIDELKCRCLASLLPGAEAAVYSKNRVNDNDLVYSINGYTGFSSQLRQISTNPQQCIAIEIRPGYLRWDNESSRVTRMISVEPNGDSGVPSSFPAVKLDPFSLQGDYVGLPCPADDENLSIEYLLSVSDRVLSLSTYICNTTTKSRTLVDWTHAMNAVVSATHFENQPIPGFAEQALASQWRREGVWETIILTAANGEIVHNRGVPIRYVTKTYCNEPLRFFLAGRRAMHKLFIRHGSTPIVKCIQAGLEHEKSIADLEDGVGGEVPAPWIHPSMEEQFRSPGWFIIT